MKNLVIEKIQEAKDNINLDLETAEERTKEVTKILEDIEDYLNVYLYNSVSEKIYEESEEFTKEFFNENKKIRMENRQFVNNFLEYLANYICFKKNESNEEKKQRSFEQRDVLNKSLINGSNGDSLRFDGSAQTKIDRNKLYKYNSDDETFGGNYKKKKKQVITSKDIKKSKILQEYKEYRKKLGEFKRNNKLDKRYVYRINRVLGSLKDDMIWIKDFMGTIYFKSPLMDSGSSKSSLFVKDTWDYMEKNYSDDELKCDFFDPDHYDTILKVLPFNNLSDNLRGIYKRFEMLETYLDLSDDKHKMLEVLKEGKSVKYDKLFYKSDNRRELIKNNREAIYDLKSLKNKLGWTYDKTKKTYYKLQENCYNAFIEMYETEFYYMYIAKGKYKQCSKCGEIKLVQRYRKDSTKNDGYYPSCKKCEQKYNNKR